MLIGLCPSPCLVRESNPLTPVAGWITCALCRNRWTHSLPFQLQFVIVHVVVAGVLTHVPEASVLVV